MDYDQINEIGTHKPLQMRAGWCMNGQMSGTEVGWWTGQRERFFLAEH